MLISDISMFMVVRLFVLVLAANLACSHFDLRTVTRVLSSRGGCEPC
uniref:Uncharacterized protein n=1 Tax=Anguilla anguilla TaxID=7936 RepID=A0A0E9XRI9_ANGAN